MNESNSCILRGHDRIVFLGDSITEQQLYTNYVETYLASRFPELKLTFFNAGWGGDTAPGGLSRLQRDVLALKPTVVVICYGMNDGRCALPDDEIRSNYVNALRQIVARLKGAGVRPVLLTPGMVDEAVSPSLAAAQYNHKGLRVLADEVLALAHAEALPVGDLHRLMNQVHIKAKAADPGFCMLPDAIHPDPSGHLVMAFGVLQALGVPPRRDQVDIELDPHAVTHSVGVRRVSLERHDDGFFLDLELDRLPFFVEPLARKVLPFIPFQETYNELILRITRLPSDCAALGTEEGRTGAIPRAQFEAGVNLFSHWSLAPTQRAAVIHHYTVNKNQIYFKIWRNLSLNGGNGADYSGAVHGSGIRLGPSLDRGCSQLLKTVDHVCRLTITPAEQAGQLLNNGNFLGQWSILGPFPRPYADDRLGGESAWSAAPSFLTATWISCDLDSVHRSVNLLSYFGQNTECFAYAVTEIVSTEAQDAKLLAGSDDGLAVWLNGVQVWQNLTVMRGVTPDQDVIPVQLQAGRNIMLLKISQGQGTWGFCARFVDLRRAVIARRLP